MSELRRIATLLSQAFASVTKVLKGLAEAISLGCCGDCEMLTHRKGV